MGCKLYSNWCNLMSDHCCVKKKWLWNLQTVGTLRRVLEIQSRIQAKVLHHKVQSKDPLTRTQMSHLREFCSEFSLQYQQIHMSQTCHTSYVQKVWLSLLSKYSHLSKSLQHKFKTVPPCCFDDGDYNSVLKLPKVFSRSHRCLLSAWHYKMFAQGNI